MYAKESLEQSLKKFPGTIIFISHDRYFIDSVADELWVIENGEMRKSSGNYSDFLQKKEQGIAYDEELIDLE
jgi:ATP-binding cassette subfamily F protein 3